MTCIVRESADLEKFAEQKINHGHKTDKLSILDYYMHNWLR